MRRWTGVGLGGWMALAPAPALAQVPATPRAALGPHLPALAGTGSTGDIDAGAPPLRRLPHLALTASLVTTLGLAQAVVAPTLTASPACPAAAGEARCSAAVLPFIDRLALAHDSGAWRLTSDFGQVAAVFGPMAAGFLVHGRRAAPGWQGAAVDDAIVVAESVAWASFVATLLKFAVRRPRPGLYRDAAGTAAQALSFPSGHVAAAAAGVGAFVTLGYLRHPGARWPHAASAAALALVGVTAAGRVLGGMHFTTDVIAGALLGAGIGVALPMWLGAGPTWIPRVAVAPSERAVALSWGVL